MPASPRSEFDFTSMNLFQTCQRKYDFRINCGLVGKTAPIAADFGKSIHRALDVWYLKKDVANAITAFRESYKESDEDPMRTYRMGEWIINNYHDKYQDQPFKVLATEQEFTLPLPNGNKLIGRIDKIIEWDGAVWGMDHKTTSMLGDSYMRMHTPNLQFSGYTWAIKQLGFNNCQGILVDAILVAKGLFEASSRNRLVPLRRDFAYRSNADIEEYLSIVYSLQRSIHHNEQIENIKDYRKIDGIPTWVPNFDSCTDYGECPYRKICKEPQEHRAKIISSEYIVEHWDPRGKEKIT